MYIPNVFLFFDDDVLGSCFFIRVSRIPFGRQDKNPLLLVVQFVFEINDEMIFNVTVGGRREKTRV
jgi:hypothetical protein